MRRITILSTLACAALAGCEPQDQALPFSVDQVQSTSKTITSAGGTLSTAAGASIAFPAGALNGTTQVTLTSAPAPAISRESGSAVSSAFKLDPQGVQLAQAAGVEVRFDASSHADRAWLASVINVTSAGVEELADTRVDLSTGLAQARIDRLGTLAVVLPDPSVVFAVQSTGVRASRQSGAETGVVPMGVRGLRMRCGEVGNRCSKVKIEASTNVLEQVGALALLYPVVRGELKIEGGTASGNVLFDTSVRMKLKGAKIAENVTIRTEIAPTVSTRVTETATDITLTGLRFRVNGSSQGRAETYEAIRTVIVPKQSTGGSLEVSREFEFRNAAGKLEDAVLKVQLPLEFLR